MSKCMNMLNLTWLTVEYLDGSTLSQFSACCLDKPTGVLFEFILTSAVQLCTALFDAHHSPKSITTVSGVHFKRNGVTCSSD